MQAPGQTDGNSGQEKKKKWVTYKAFLTDHNMATHEPSSTVSDQMTFCEGERGGGWGQSVTPVRSQNR